jgi:hypothetical protein
MCDQPSCASERHVHRMSYAEFLRAHNFNANAVEWINERIVRISAR